MKNLSHFDEKSQSFWPSQVGRYASATGILNHVQSYQGRFDSDQGG